jgi:hypothetical protein
MEGKKQLTDWAYENNPLSYVARAWADAFNKTQQAAQNRYRGSQRHNDNMGSGSSRISGFHNSGSQMPGYEPEAPHIFNPNVECPEDPSDPRNILVTQDQQQPKPPQNPNRVQICYVNGSPTQVVIRNGQYYDLKGRPITGKIECK